MKKCQFPLCVAASVLLSVLSAQAHPYASGVTNSGGTIKFTLNESATDVKVIFNNTLVTNDLGALAAGVHSFALGSYTNYAIVVSKTGAGTYNQISSDSDNYVQFFGPRGVAVNQNPQRPNFGRVYVENPWPGTAGNGRAVGKGVYLLNADLSDAVGQGNTALVAGMSLGTSLRYSPYKIGVGIDDTVYVGDAGGYYTANTAVGASAGTEAGGIWAVAPDFSSSTDLFNPSQAEWNGGTMYGGVIGTPIAQGSLAAGNLVVYACEWDLAGYQNIWQYSGNSSLPFANNPTDVAFAGNGSVNGVLADIAIEPLSGNLYTMEERGATTGAGNITLRVFDSTGTANLLWDSQTASGGTDPMVLSYGIAISPDGKWLANILGNGSFLLTPITNGIPDLALMVTNPIVASPTYSSGLPTASEARGGIGWDAADNVYLTLTANDAPTSGAPAVLRVYSLGFNTVAITMNDTTATNGSFQFFILWPPPTITAAAVTGGNVALTFTSPTRNDTTASFTVQSSAVVSGGFSDVTPAPTITQPGGVGTPFQTTVPTSGPNQFYRIRHL